MQASINTGPTDVQIAVVREIMVFWASEQRISKYQYRQAQSVPPKQPLSPLHSTKHDCQSYPVESVQMDSFAGAKDRKGNWQSQITPASIFQLKSGS